MIARLRDLVSILIKKWVPVFIVTITGMYVLIGYLIPNSRWSYYRDRLIEWAVIVAAFAFVLGMVNILRVHGSRVIRRRRGWPYSLTLLVFALLGLVPPLLGIVSRDNLVQETLDRIVFDYLISPLGASLAALVALTLALAAFRLLRTRRGSSEIAQGWLFILAVVVVLLTSTPLVMLDSPVLDLVQREIVKVMGMAGMRGLLLGVALGTVITAIRVLVISDRPHSEF